jgi:flagellar basal-body rod protein FlgF
MDNTTLITLSRQGAMRRSMDVIANNLANLNTTAFKTETVLFEEYLADVTAEDGTTEQLTLVRDYGNLRNVSEGSFYETGSELNLAIRGDAYMVTVTDEGEERYTRNGSLSVDEEGQLIAASGDPILNSDGSPIIIGTSDYNFNIAKDGSISTSDGPKGKLMLVRFENQQMMRKVGSGTFSTEETPLPVEKTSIIQGMLERSNVSSILEMTRMIDVSRSYMSAAKAMETNGSLIRKAINELATV